jgi:hypothetical protein
MPTESTNKVDPACYGKNSIPVQINLCCDARQDICPYFMLLETDEYRVPLCLYKFSPPWGNDRKG